MYSTVDAGDEVLLLLSKEKTISQVALIFGVL
jgi:hypothetical protein